MRRAHEALNAGDIETLVAVCDADFRLDMSDRVLNPSVYEGHDGIRAFYAEVMDIWESFTWEPTELREFNEVVVSLLESKGKGRGSGLELDRRSAMLWHVSDEKALSLTFYRDPDAALAAAPQA
ncbi:MAG: SnoaL-like domain [Geminicoccaceae bacterium]|nr:SnoaL-like domain [Geminicoccaceae bacterium]